ncbi:MAG: glutamate 5-kinase [Candidatus Omnitrophota bacterium]|nr:glutamate 5-kinase [Candidatus Omnitrophota bacterium]
MRDRLKTCRRIVIKVGTSILTSRKGRFTPRSVTRLVAEVSSLWRHQKEVVLVSSGAIALGMEVGKLRRRPRKMDQLQACAAMGQGKLMHAYEQSFSRRGMHSAQLLLTRDGLEQRNRYLCVRQTLSALLEMKVVPIINENDTVATEEIAFGDNDILSVYVADLVHADLLVILSDVDGFHLRDGSRIRRVDSAEEIDKELVRHIRDSKTHTTVGGMKAKLEAARIAMRLAVPLLIVNGHREGIIQQALAGEDVGTLFLPGTAHKSARKKWIAFSAPRRGRVVVDDGAYEALSRRKSSLLPRGIVEVHGNFEKGHVVELSMTDGSVFGRGVAQFSSRDLVSLVGKKTAEIHEILGYKAQDEAIHRNNLVLWR